MWSGVKFYFGNDVIVLHCPDHSVEAITLLAAQWLDDLNKHTI
jgi:hypothetical protein